MEEMSDSEIQQLPKAAQSVVRKEMGEAREARNILSSWTRAFGGNNCGDQPQSAQQEGPPDPANVPAAAASEKPTTQTAGAGSNKDRASKIPPRQKGRAAAKRKAGRAEHKSCLHPLPSQVTYRCMQWTWPETLIVLPSSVCLLYWELQRQSLIHYDHNLLQ